MNALSLVARIGALFCLFVAVSALGGASVAQTSLCAPSWLPTFNGSHGTNGTVATLAVFDDGGGGALYAGGQFDTAGEVVANRIAKWDGLTWTALGSSASNGVNGSEVLSLAVFDDGNGPSLYAGGNFTDAGGVVVSNIAKWDGTSWSALGTGTDDTVRALVVFDDGSGAALYAAGDFQIAGGVAANRIAKWDGMNWTPLGSGMNELVTSLAVFDDGGGEALFAGGLFTTAGGGAANRVARWNGANWNPLAGGVDQVVKTLAVFDDGTGEVLIVGGLFGVADGMAASSIASWDGASWSALGSGRNTSVDSLAVFDDGGGVALYAGGFFTTAGGAPANRIAKWDGGNWTALGSGMNNLGVSALAVFDDGGGAALYAGGDFTNAGNAAPNRIAKWNGTNWTALVGILGITAAVNGSVNAMTVFDDGSGEALFVGGTFTVAGDVAANRIARWDGSSWSALGSGLVGVNSGNFQIGVRALAVFDDGSGPALFVGGEFFSAGGLLTNKIAKWDGTSWSALGSGLSGSSSSNPVYALATFDDGNGPALYVGGQFSMAGGAPASNIAKWDGSSWTAVGNGVNTTVSVLRAFDDGSGAALYVGGSFTNVGGLPIERIARWDGASWGPVGPGFNGSVSALSVFDDGNGEQLFAGGSFSSAGLTQVRNIAKWNGTFWEGLGSGTNRVVRALIVFDDGSGDALYAAGNFTSTPVVSNKIARWDGSAWSALGGGIGTSSSSQSGALALGGFKEALYVGGQFLDAIDSGDNYLAKWSCPGPLTDNLCNGDGGDGLGCTDCPCGNNIPPVTGGTIGGCLNSALTGSRLIASGDPSVSLPPSSTSDLRFALTSAPPNAFCLLNSGDALAPTSMTNPCFGLGTGAQASVLDGLRCAVTNTRRHGGRSADVNGEVGFTNAPWGGEGAPASGIAGAGSGYVAGQTRFFQIIHRDDPLAQCMRGLNTSQAVSVVFAP